MRVIGTAPGGIVAVTSPCAALQRPLAERPLEAVAPEARPARRMPCSSRKSVEPRRSTSAYFASHDDLRRMSRPAERLHRVVERRAAAVERRGHVGDVGSAPLVQSSEPLDVGEPPRVDARLGARERALQLAPGAGRRLEEAERAEEVAVAGDGEVHVLEEDRLLRREVDARLHVVEHLRPVREIDVAGDLGRRAGALEVDAPRARSCRRRS